MSQIDILLATYNGAAFLPEQLASLERQSHTDWHLLVRDDGSRDGSLDVVRDWAQRSGRSVTIIEDGQTGLGASLNFARLIAASGAPYFACCDQDDVWLDEKLAVMLCALQAQEATLGAAVPLLAWSDLQVVDRELAPIAASFRRYSRRPVLQPGRVVPQLMLHNVVTGCASLGNAALRKAALPVPPAAMMHDWWMALVAAGLGQLVDVPQPTILYRQHGGNTLGAVANDPLSLARWVLRDADHALARTRRLLAGTQAQAGAFAEIHRAELAPEMVELLTDYAQLPASSWPARKAFFARHRLLADNVLKNLPLFILA